MTLHQVHRLVQLALGAMAVGFAALAGTIGESATKKPLAGGQLGNAGTEVAFGRRKFGADEGLNHILYHTLYKIRMESKRKNAIRICPSLGSGLKHQWNQMIWSARELGCGIAAISVTYRNAASFLRDLRSLRAIGTPYCLRSRNLKVGANLAREEVVHLAVAWNRLRLAG